MIKVFQTYFISIWKQNHCEVPHACRNSFFSFACYALHCDNMSVIIVISTSHSLVPADVRKWSDLGSQLASKFAVFAPRWGPNLFRIVLLTEAGFVRSDRSLWWYKPLINSQMIRIRFIPNPHTLFSHLFSWSPFGRRAGFFVISSSLLVPACYYLLIEEESSWVVVTLCASVWPGVCFNDGYVFGLI